MALYKGPVAKRCRTLGISPNELGNKKDTHKKVAVSRKKPSEYSIQLKEKQKAKFIYGVLEKQFRLYYAKAEKMRGITGENMLILLERRLDNVAFRMGIGTSRAMARQIVSHGLLTVNGKTVDIPSFQVKKGDVIAVKENKKDKGCFAATKEVVVNKPRWLEFDTEKLEGKVLDYPTREDITVPIEEHLIVELYSK